MPISNSTLSVVSSRPYFDDFDGDHKFYRILFRPRRAIQTREGNQIQSILQDQIERFAGHIFKNGSMVHDGGLTLDTGVKSIKVSRTFGAEAIDLDEFFDTDTQVGTTITGATSGTKARVVLYDEREGETYAVLIVQYLSNAEFTAGETISNGTASASIAGTDDDPFDDASIMSVSDGIYFIDGMFITVDAHSIVLEAFSNTPSYRVGFTVGETIITHEDDDDLLDNALGSSNYLAPGADRLKITLELDKKALTGSSSTTAAADEQFVELARVVNGELTKLATVPQYAELEKTLARRTYDESGHYTVRPFNVQVQNNVGGDTTKVSIGLDNGKAYVHGYEFETIGTQYVDVRRGRDTAEENNFDISMGFGNYIVANSVLGFLNITNHDVIDLHSVAKGSVDFSSTTTYNATHIGTARVRSMTYLSGGANGIYNIYITDPRLRSLTLSANTSNSTGIQLASANASSVNDAYKGATLTITAGPGTGQTFTVTAYTGSTRFATLDPPTYLGTFTANTTTTTRLDFAFGHVESFSKPTSAASSTSTANGNIGVEGRVGLVANGDAVLVDSDNSLLFPFPHAWIKSGSLSDLDYETIRVFTNVTFSGNSTVTNLTLNTNNGNERFYPSPKTLTEAEFLASYLVVSNANGAIIPFNANGISAAVIASVSSGVPGQITLTANGTNVPDGNVVSVLARLNINSASPRTKTLVSGNTTATTGTNLAVGQLVIASPNNTPGAIMSLYTPDVTRIKAIYTTPNVGTAPSNTYTTTVYDVTDRFTLDTGQRDNLYDHASIRLKTTAAPVSGQLLVCFDYYSHSGNGFFTVDSYLDTDYASIPSYTSPATGRTHELRDVLDFRPTRQANTSEAMANVFYTVQNVQLPHPVSTFEADYEHYLGRTDALLLTRDREFKIVEGVSSSVPQQPPVTDDSMVLYYITVGPYTPNTGTVSVKYVENKRYTMRDIGRLERRVENLEYFTALNSLEKAARDQVILDDNNVERFKNGLLVEPFVGHTIADVQDDDYLASIDTHERNLMPSVTTNGHSVSYVSANSSGVQRTGDLVTLSYSTDAFISQPLSSNEVAINPFQVTNYLGQMTLTPSSDVWFDSVNRPAVHMNVVGENDNWLHVGFGTEWNDWTYRWLGASSEQSRGDAARLPYASRFVSDSTAPSTLITKLQPETISRTAGNRVVDISVVPYIRSANMWFSVAGLKPSTNVRAYFDGTDVTNYTERANMLTLTSNVAFLDTTGVYETVTANTGGTARVIAVRGNKVKIVEANGEFLFANGASALLTGATSNLTANIASYEHWSGTAQSANSTGIILNAGASANNDYYNGLTIYITRGGGVGGSATITDYDGSTKFATINTTSSTVNTSAITSSTRYSIGNLTTDGLANSTIFTTAGDCHGVFYIPNDDTLRFRAGSRLFRLTDNADQTVATTAADAQYHVNGTTITSDGAVVSTRPTVVRRAAVANDTVVITNRVINENHDGWVDPVVQTIIIDPLQYPSGVFVKSVELYFKAKDEHGVPVTVQIRPTLNGYSLNGVIVPFAEKTLHPTAVNVANTPSVDTANTATTFTFPALVHLLPGEYAINVLTNSKAYTLHSAKIGSHQSNTALIISQQPYAGKLFKSQNVGEWIPEDDEDLMFRVHRAVFATTNTGTALFSVTNPSANVDFDTFHVATGHLDFAGTVSTFAYQATNTTGSLTSTSTTLTPNQNVGLTTRQRLLNSGNTFNIRATITSSDDAVSPVFDVERMSFISVKHNIGNGELYANGFVVTNPGTGYGASTNVALTITGTGSGAEAVATTNSSGNITGVTVVTEGSGYSESPTITVGGSGSGATIIFAGETGARGGNGLTRYITRRVTLADEFDASDLVVSLKAYRPVGTSVDVYYKVLSASDPESFDDKNWTQMDASGALTYSANERDYREFTYTTSEDTAAYTANGVTYNRFKTFAIKVVLRSSSTTIKPHVRDLRAIAVDE